MAKNVLIVDDSAVMRKIIAKALQEADLGAVEIHEAADGVEGLEKLTGNAIDLIICDINMPNMNGIEFLGKMQELKLPKRVPVVMVTTEGTEETIKEAAALGASAYVVKPFTPEQLRLRVLSVLN
jgi:two-component system chemotaxis response regulator CheY